MLKVRREDEAKLDGNHGSLIIVTVGKRVHECESASKENIRLVADLSHVAKVDHLHLKLSLENRCCILKKALESVMNANWFGQ